MAVYLDAIHDYDLEKIKGIVERGMRSLGMTVDGARTAVVKPNLVQALPPESGVITNPVVVEAIIDVLRDYGVKDIAIAEAPALGVSAAKAFAIGGYEELAHRKHVRLVDLMDAPRTRVHTGYGYKDVPNVFDDAELSNYSCGYMSIPNVMLESDIYINVPKLKTHNRATITLSMKNQWALLCFKDRQMYHRIGLHEPIVQLARAVKPHLCVIDGIVGMEGNGPILGKPVPVGAVAVGRNMVETDIVGSELMAKDPRSVIHLRQAVETGLGDWKTDVQGERVEDMAVDFEPAPQDVKRNHNFYLWRNHRACHLDDDAFVQAAKIARKNPRYWPFLIKLGYYSFFKRIDVVRGRGMKMPEFHRGQKIILSGNCSADILANYEEIPKNVVHIPGCPPKPEDIIKAVIRM